MLRSQRSTSEEVIDACCCCWLSLDRLLRLLRLKSVSSQVDAKSEEEKLSRVRGGDEGVAEEEKEQFGADDG